MPDTTDKTVEAAEAAEAAETNVADDSAWIELAAILADLKKRYDDLLKLLNNKEHLIIKGKDKDLDKIVKQEQDQINNIEKTEKKRIKAALACRPGSKDAPSLKELLEIAPENHREALEQTAVGLLKTMNNVSVANHSVAEMVQEAMNFVNYQINLMGSDPARDNIYEETGKMKENKPKVRGIINREA